MKNILLGLFILLFFNLSANDGSFYTSGNHLIPIFETDISVKKETLRIERINNDEVKIIVDYEFVNPRNAKEIVVGFEAPSPQGDVSGYPKGGRHPYIRDFTVLMNGNYLPFKTAIVADSNYVKDGEIKSRSVADVVDENFEENYPDFYYVNYFNAKFERGLNKIKHEYIFKLSSSVEINYGIDYILTAANRWANGQIDDFTLIIDLGGYNDFSINRSFFAGFEGWSGANKLMDGSKLLDLEMQPNPMRVFTNDQPITFKKLNFRPSGELSIFSQRYPYDSKLFNHLEHLLPYELNNFSFVETISNDSHKILRNHPYAKRGYIFKHKLIQEYYETLDWYVSNRDYMANLSDLTSQEQRWLDELKSED